MDFGVYILDYDTLSCLGQAVLIDERLAVIPSGDPALYPQHRAALLKINHAVDGSEMAGGEWGVFTYYSERPLSSGGIDVVVKYSALYQSPAVAERDYGAYGPGALLSGNTSRSYVLSARCDPE